MRSLVLIVVPDEDPASRLFRDSLTRRLHEEGFAAIARPETTFHEGELLELRDEGVTSIRFRIDGAASMVELERSPDGGRLAIPYAVKPPFDRRDHGGRLRIVFEGGEVSPRTRATANVLRELKRRRAAVESVCIGEIPRELMRIGMPDHRFERPGADELWEILESCAAILDLSDARPVSSLAVAAGQSGCAVICHQSIKASFDSAASLCAVDSWNIDQFADAAMNPGGCSAAPSSRAFPFDDAMRRLLGWLHES